MSKRLCSRGRWRQLAWALLMGAVWIVAGAWLYAQYPTKNPEAACAGGNRKDTATVRSFVFTTYQSEVGSCLQVFHDGKVVFRRTGDSFESFGLGQPADPQDGIPAIASDTDLTGDGRPDAIATLNTGGAHCCMSHFVFELEPAFKLLATLDDADDYAAHFEPSGTVGSYIYRTEDWTFAYWKTSFAESPGVAVILRFTAGKQGGGFHLAMDTMRTPDLSAAQWDKLSSEASGSFKETNSFSGGIGAELWGEMLNLIYGSHSELAWKLFDGAWPPDRKGKNEFLSDFCSQLKTSPYWADLQPTLRDTPAACADAKPKKSS